VWESPKAGLPKTKYCYYHKQDLYKTYRNHSACYVIQLFLIEGILVAETIQTKHAMLKQTDFCNAFIFFMV